MSSEAGSAMKAKPLLVKLPLLSTRDDELFPVRGTPKRVPVEVLGWKMIYRPGMGHIPGRKSFCTHAPGSPPKPEQPRGRLSPGSTVSPPHARTHHQRIPTLPPPPGGSRGPHKVHWEALQAATSARPINRWSGWLFKRPTANCQNFFRIWTGAGGL